MIHQINSIKAQLLLWLLVPLLVLSLLCTAVAYSYALDISQKIYDELLLNSADSIIARTNLEGDNLVLRVSKVALTIFRHIDKDDFYFKITDGDGRFLVGDQFINSDHMHSSTEPVYGNGSINGANVRICVTGFEARSAPARNTEPQNKDRVIIYTSHFVPPTGQDPQLFVVLAETCRARNAMAQKILAGSLLLELMLIAGGAAAVWVGVGRGLASLRQIQDAIAKRTPWDLKELQIAHPADELVSLIRTINQVLTLLREHIEEQSTFVSNAAHELKTPLAGLKTNLDLASGSAHTEQEVELFSSMHEGINRMSSMVKKLLALARAEGDAAVPKSKGQIDLNDVIARALDALREQAQEKQIGIEFTGSQKPSLIFGDSEGLTELVDNLVLNAIAFSPNQGTIDVCTVNEEGKVSLSVQDGGPGIPEGERTKVFQRFYRLPGNHGRGSGLGLAIVKKIADSHLATVSIGAGREGSGCRVVVNFNENMKLVNHSSLLRSLR